MPEYTETKRIFLATEAQPNAVLIRWIGPFNNWEHYVFSGKYKKDILTEKTVNYTSEDLRNDITAKIEGTVKMLIRGMIPDKKQADGIKTLFTSPIKKIVLDGIEQSFIIAEGSFSLLDLAVKHGSIEFEITLNRVNSLTN